MRAPTEGTEEIIVVTGMVEAHQIGIIAGIETNKETLVPREDNHRKGHTGIACGAVAPNIYM